jgi:hypothetical protein
VPDRTDRLNEDAPIDPQVPAAAAAVDCAADVVSVSWPGGMM